MKYQFSILILAAAPLLAQKFYPDDPLQVEPQPRDASGAQARKVSDYYDFLQNTFHEPGTHAKSTGEAVASQGVNTLGEPMDGAWYTKRHYYQRMSLDELQAGAGNKRAPTMDQRWTVVKAKSEGVTPGFEIVDSQNRRYVLKFDPPGHPELATAPDVISSKFFYALGYHVPENYIVHFTEDQLVLRDGVILTDAKGKKRPMTRTDLSELLSHLTQGKDGRYRALASLYLSGKPLGPFKYAGTRKDDPNDVVLHENRRDLRGLRVFAAWLGHDDSRAINTLDMLVNDGGTPHIRHHLIDFGSTLGSASYGPNSPRAGFEYLFAWGPAMRQVATLGLAPQKWTAAKYQNDPSAGRFEAAKFEPQKWVPEYPNPAFDNMQPEDAFWAAKQVMAFTDDEIRAIVATGEYSDARVADSIAQMLIERRNKIGRAFLGLRLPVDHFQISNGQLQFVDLTEAYGLSGASKFEYRWFTVDSNGARAEISGTTSNRVPASESELVLCEVSSQGPRVSVYVRPRTSEVVGLVR